MPTPSEITAAALAEMRLAAQGYRNDMESNDPVLREWAEVRLPVLEMEIAEMERQCTTTTKSIPRPPRGCANSWPTGSYRKEK